jgi:tRNA pseudouridine55 synthase
MRLMDGLLIIDKPAGLTSHDVVSRARRILRERRIGHAGTLDPFATGVLVLLVGRATRLAQFISGAEKEYEATVRLGVATDTGDLEGTPLPQPQREQKLCWSDRQLQDALHELTGCVSQVPPMYSAKKREGRKLYELARRGEEVVREPVKITIHEFALCPASGSTDETLKHNADGTADLNVRVVCSAGTYVRTLAEDFGKLLGVGAHLVRLRRTRAGAFHLRNATTLEQLQQSVDDEALHNVLLPANAALSHLPFVHLSSEDARKARNGRPVSLNRSGWADATNVRIEGAEGGLIGVGSYDAINQLLLPRVILAAENTD